MDKTMHGEGGGGGGGGDHKAAERQLQYSQQHYILAAQLQYLQACLSSQHYHNPALWSTQTLGATKMASANHGFPTHGPGKAADGTLGPVSTVNAFFPI